MSTSSSVRPGHFPPRKRGIPFHIMAPAVLALATASLLGWSALATFKPVPRVMVGRVLPISVSPENTPDSTTVETPAKVVPTVQAPGWIEPDPYPTAAAALADGVLEEILVLEGQSVERGQLIARLVVEDADLDLQAAQAELDLAESDHQHAQARLTAAQANWDNPVRLDREVAVAQALVDELQARIAQLPSSITEARANLRSKEQEAQRISKAAASGSASEIELIIAEAASEALRAMVEFLVRQESILQSQLRSAVAEHRAAERDLELRIDDRLALASAEAGVLGAASRLERARVARDTAQLRVDRMRIHAPMGGLVLQRLKAPGDKVMRGMDDPRSAQVLLLYDPQRLQVRADVPLAEASHISVGQKCEVFCEVLPDQTFTGTVTRITNEADLQRNTLEIKVRIEDPSEMLKPEMLARVRFLGSNDSMANGPESQPQAATWFTVPTAAVQESGRVQVVRERSGLRGRIRTLMVEPGDLAETSPDLIRVRGELRQTDLVVLGEPEYQDGTLVEISTEVAASDTEGGRS